MDIWKRVEELGRRSSFPLTIPIIFVSLILVGTVGLNYIASLLFGTVELQIGYLAASLLILGVSLFLSLRIIYQIDRRSKRLKKRVNLFEPVTDEEENE